MTIKFKLLLSTTLILSSIITYSNATSELNTSFTAAVRGNDVKKVQELLKAGADVNTPIKYIQTSGDCDWDMQTTPLKFALSRNQLEMAKTLLQGKKIPQDLLNQTLNNAVARGAWALVEALLQEGADLNNTDNNDQDTPLILAVKNARPLSEFSSQAQARFDSGWSSRKKIIETLLKAGASVRHTNKRGSTALIEAVKTHDLLTVQELLKHPEMTRGSFFGFGQKPINYADEDGNTALIIAVNYIRTMYISGNSQEYMTCLNSQNIVEALLKTPGIDPYHVNKKGETAISLLEREKAKYSKYSY